MKLLLLLFALLIAGCNGEARLSPEQAQDAAAAREGARAARAVADRIAMPEIDEATRARLMAELQEILAGTAGYVFAALELAELPAATCPPPILKPAAFAQAGSERAKNPAPPAPAWPAWLSTIGAVLGIAAGGGVAVAGGKFLAPLIPGLRTLWRAGADGLWSILQHREGKAADERAQAALAATERAGAVLRAFRDGGSPQWNALPQDARDAIAAVIGASKAGA